MITFNSVSKNYSYGSGGLTDISFEVEDNDFIFLVGPSGAGKTTILKLIMKQLMPTTGSIIVDGQDITDKKFNDMVKLRRKIGMVFQDFKVLTNHNVFENIALGLKVTGVSDKKIKESVDELLNLVGIEEKKFMFPLQLSAGELQRVAIARSIIGDRTILLADEPTGNLDPKTTWDIMKLFKKLEKKRTIIIATHNAEIVNSFKKRVITLTDGKIIKDQRGGGYHL